MEFPSKAYAYNYKIFFQIVGQECLQYTKIIGVTLIKFKRLALSQC
jgi:hypothetical protein